jgi:hypothetical protein
MIPANAIYELLRHNTTIARLVGDNIFPMVRPQNLKHVPAIVHRLISNEPTNVKNGPSTLDTITYQFSMFAPPAQYDELMEVREAVRFTLERINQTVAGIQVQSCMLDAQREPFEEDAQMLHFADDYRFRIIRNPVDQQSIAAYQYLQRVDLDGGAVNDFNAIKNLTLNT